MTAVDARLAGDSALLLQFEAVIDPQVNARAIAAARVESTMRPFGVMMN